MQSSGGQIFIVVLSDGKTRKFSDKAHFHIHEASGVLEVRDAPDFTGVYFGPTGWQRLEVTSDYDL